MPKFVVERDVPGVGTRTEEEWQVILRRSCDVLKEMGPEIEWIQSYVTQDKLYCVFNAPDRETVLRHSQKGDLKVTRVERVWTVIDPSQRR